MSHAEALTWCNSNEALVTIRNEDFVIVMQYDRLRLEVHGESFPETVELAKKRLDILFDLVKRAEAKTV